MPKKLDPVHALAFLIPEPGPRRIYALNVLISSFGFGLVFTAMTLYATSVVHLSPAAVGLGLTIAGLAGLLAAIPIGDVADRRDPGQVVRASMLVQCAAVVGYLFVHDFATFVTVAVVDLLAYNASLSADGALLRRVGGEGAAAFRSSTQAISNLGISLGLLGCGVAEQLNTADAYRSLFAMTALTLLVGMVILRRLPRYAPLPRPEQGRRWEALADKPFVTYTVANGLMFIQYLVIILLLPLWVVHHTHAPRWSISLYVLINTIFVVLFQVRVGRNVETLRQAGAGLRRAGIIFLLSCSAMGLAAGLPGWAAALLLATAVTLHTYGELWHAAATFALDFGLAPEHAQGQYQGLAGIGSGAGAAAAPILLIGVCLSLGRLGFVALGACLALIGFTGPALARWGERTRPASAPAADVQPQQG